MFTHQMLLKPKYTDNVGDIIFFIVCKIHFPDLWFYRSIRLEGNNKSAKNVVTSVMECVYFVTFTFAMWQIWSCLLCNFISLRASLFSFPSILHIFRQENRVQRSEGKWNICKPSKGPICKDCIIGREIATVLKIAVNKDTVWQIRAGFLCKFISPEAMVFSSFAIIFCRDFLRIYWIEVNSLVVWSKRVKRCKGKLIICQGKPELARTCSVYINAQDNHLKFTMVT